MSNKIKEFQNRRYKRLLARLDADDNKGQWITTENGHKVHLNEEGEPDKGNPRVVAAMNGESSGNNGGSSRPEVTKRQSVDFLKKSGAGWYAGLDDFQESFEGEGFSILDMTSEYATIEDEAGNEFTVKYDVTSTGRTLQIDTIEDVDGESIYEAPTRERLLRQQEEESDPDDDDWDDEDDEEDW